MPTFMHTNFIIRIFLLISRFHEAGNLVQRFSSDDILVDFGFSILLGGSCHVPYLNASKVMLQEIVHLV